MAIALRETLRQRRPETRFLFIGTEHGLEVRLLPPLKFPLKTIRIGGLQGLGPRRRLLTLFQIPTSVVASRRLLKDFGMALVVGLGGYSSGPVLVAAKLMGRPTMIIEPNSAVGLANRWLGPWVDAAAVAFEETTRQLGKRAHLTGIPIRPEFHQVRSEVRPQGALRILVVGGSRGSVPINTLVCEALPYLDAENIRIRHQTGPKDLERVRRVHRQHHFNGPIDAFIDDMPSCYAVADLIISRAGASTVAEIAATGRPSILIPFPAATDDHQRRNAQSLVDRGAALLLEQQRSSGRQLAELIRSLENQRQRLQGMSRAARALARPHSADRIADLMEEVVAA